jgi:hypothetical protein
MHSRFRNILIFLFAGTLLMAFIPLHRYQFTIDRSEAKKAYEWLNNIRLHPELYYSSLKLDRSLGITKTSLNWNESLAGAAEKKALDMAKRNYFGHIDPDGYGMNYHIQKAGYTLNNAWLKNKSNNYFESIMMNADSGVDAIRTLILDEGVEGKGHRNHLLGIGSWNASLRDIGIGYARFDSADIHQSYISILIAKHEW